MWARSVLQNLLIALMGAEIRIRIRIVVVRIVEPEA
jgi:hypothetical protein